MPTFSICDEPFARRASMSALIAEDNLGLVDADLATVATARTASDNAVIAGSICDYPIGQQCSRGFTVASAYSATFGSTFTAFYASLPDNYDHKQRMITM